MDKVIPSLQSNAYWLVPMAIYVALNLAKREWLVNNPDPTVRAVAGMIEKILVLEWDKWGGRLK